MAMVPPHRSVRKPQVEPILGVDYNRISGYVSSGAPNRSWRIVACVQN
jgi:hypothetical protein